MGRLETKVSYDHAHGAFERHPALHVQVFPHVCPSRRTRPADLGPWLESLPPCDRPSIRLPPESFSALGELGLRPPFWDGAVFGVDVRDEVDEPSAVSRVGPVAGPLLRFELPLLASAQ